MSQPKLLKVNKQMINPEAVVGLRWIEPERLVVFCRETLNFSLTARRLKRSGRTLIALAETYFKLKRIHLFIGPQPTGHTRELEDT
jgi:hypothetical protein